MSLSKDEKQNIRVYTFHGVDLTIKDKEAVGCCPWCNSSDKFTVDIEKSVWRCFVCGENGNQYTFIRKLWQEGLELQNATDYSPLVESRGLSIETLKEWGVVKSITTQNFLVPGFSTDGKLTQLYRWMKVDGGKYRLLATPTLGQKIHGMNLYNLKNKNVFLCEGPWDAMKLWEVMKSHKMIKGKIIRTKTKNNLLKDTNILAVPGCQTFGKNWHEVFVNKKVYIVYDNDHPKKHPITKKLIKPPAFTGVQTVTSKLAGKAEEIGYLKWGPKGYDRNLPNGYDLRDHLEEKQSSQLENLYERLTPVPEDWLVTEAEKEAKEKQINPKHCESWSTLIDAWKQGMKWDSGLDIALSVMLASAMSTELESDPLWVKIIGPPSCGKSTLCEAMSVARKWVYPKDKMTGLVSGFKGKPGDEDFNPVTKLKNKTVAIKDADTILSSGSKDVVLSELRGLYDGALRSEYKNGMGTDFEDVHCSIVLCGTSSLREMDASELGARFLDCVIMHGVSDEHEDMVLASNFHSHMALLQGKVESNGRAGKSKLIAMEYTGGYLDYLRNNYRKLIGEIKVDDDIAELIPNVAKFVAYMRARPSKKQKDVAEREFSVRLSNQLSKLAVCLAAVMNKTTVDKEVMSRVIKVAMDTTIGHPYDICSAIYDSAEETADPKWLALMTNRSLGETRNMLRFLKDIGAVEPFSQKRGNVTTKPKWRLTKTVHGLFEQILDWKSTWDQLN